MKKVDNWNSRKDPLPASFSLLFPDTMTRVYRMYHRGLGLLAVVWFGSFPLLFTLSRKQAVSLSQSSCMSPVVLLGGGGSNHTTARKPGPLWCIKYSLTMTRWSWQERAEAQATRPTVQIQLITLRSPPSPRPFIGLGQNNYVQDSGSSW